MDTINRVYRGEIIIDQAVFQQIVSDYTRLSKRVSDDSDTKEAHNMRKDTEKQSQERMLTPREQEILYHLARGLTNKEISTATNLAVDTVKTHLRNIFRKLGVKNRTQAISQAINMGSTIPIYAPGIKTEDA
jgi:DNA-binding NarL/FixJ family response regulator